MHCHRCAQCIQCRWNPSASGLIVSGPVGEERECRALCMSPRAVHVQVAEFDGAKPHLARYVSIIQVGEGGTLDYQRADWHCLSGVLCLSSAAGHE